MTLDIASYRRQLREHIGLTGDDVETLPGTDTADKTGADTYLNRSYWEVLDLFPVRAKEVIATFHTTQGRDFYKIPNSFEALQAISITDPNSFKHDPLDRIEKDYFEQKFVDRTDDEGKPDWNMYWALRLAVQHQPNHTQARCKAAAFETFDADTELKGEPMEIARRWLQAAGYGDIPAPPTFLMAGFLLFCLNSL